MAKRRGKGEGSITQLKNGLWQARITYHEDGVVKRKAFYGKTRKEAQEKLTEALANLQRGLPLAPNEKQTVGEFIQHWLETVAKGQLRPNTYESYCQVFRIRILPHIGGVRLTKLTPQHISGMYAKLQESGLSARSAQYAHAVLHKALNQAVRWNLIPRNPADLVDAPKPKRKELDILSPEQAEALIQAAKGERLEALFVLAITTGLRKGELLGLKWQDVDWNEGKLHVRRALTSVKGGFLEQPPKNGKGRTVVLTKLALNALHKHRAKQLEERLQAGEYWHGSDYVFASEVGRPLQPKTVFAKFKHLLKKAGLPDIRFHDLRHTAATLLLRQGVHPKVVQEMLGHSSIQMTMDVYSHVLPDLQREAANKLDSLFGS